MTKLIRTLTAFYRKACNLILWVQVFNLFFAIGIFLLYFSYYPFPQVTDYTPSTWDYSYFTWEKVILVLFFVILFAVFDDFRIRLQTGLLGAFSLVRLAWQIIEWVNGTFARGEEVFFILSSITLLVTLLTIIFPVQMWTFKRMRKKETQQIEKEISDNSSMLETIIF